MDDQPGLSPKSDEPEFETKFAPYPEQKSPEEARLDEATFRGALIASHELVQRGVATPLRAADSFDFDDAVRTGEVDPDTKVGWRFSQNGELTFIKYDLKIDIFSEASVSGGRWGSNLIYIDFDAWDKAYDSAHSKGSEDDGYGRVGGFISLHDSYTATVDIGDRSWKSDRPEVQSELDKVAASFGILENLRQFDEKWLSTLEDGGVFELTATFMRLANGRRLVQPS